MAFFFLVQSTTLQLLEPVFRKRTVMGTLNFKLAEKIRRKHETGRYKQTELAEKFNVSTSLINQVIKNQVWTQEVSQPSGERHGMAKITAKDALKIRQRYAKGDITQTVLAEKFGISQGMVYRIVTGKAWATVDGPTHEAVHVERPRTKEERIEHFWSKVNKVKGGCWEWKASTFPDGYGQHKWKGKNRRAHILAYEIHHGKKVPEGMMVLHKCDNRKCTKPKHLFTGTNADNMADMVSKGRSLKGEKNPASKLTDKQVRKIRKLHATGRYTQKQLGKKFDVTQQAIGRVVDGVSYK